MTAADLNSARIDAADPKTAAATIRKVSGLSRRLQPNRQRVKPKGVTLPLVRCGLTVLAAVMAVVAAPLARADDADTAFLDAMRSHGIGSMTGNNQDLIKVGRSVCDLLAGGYSINAVIDMSKRISDEDPTYLVRTAAATYCPQLNH